MQIRKATLGDFEQITEIYNYYIKNTHQTFETEELSADEMAERIAAISAKYPYLVAEANGEIFGYAYASQFKMRRAYQYCAEVSIYVKHEAKQRGIGTDLYDQLFKDLKETNIHSVVAGISLPNDESVKFHERRGFFKVAHFHEIGYKLGRWIDVGFWQLTNAIDD